jgi:hypothetical protein
MNSVLPSHSLDHPGVVKIALSAAASEALAAVGENHLLLATKADATAPDAMRGRMIVLCLPCSREAADAAFRVATGKARAVTIRTKPTEFSDNLTPIL